MSANSVDHDQMPQKAASDHALQCLHVSPIRVSSLKRVKRCLKHIFVLCPFQLFSLGPVYGWMTDLHLRTFPSVFQSYQVDGLGIVYCCMQKNPVMVEN